MPNTRPAALELPPGCHAPSGRWPWPRALDQARFQALRFDHSLEPDDFDAWDIALPPRLETAAPKRRAEFLAGRLSARKALFALTGKAVGVGQDEERLPLWPDETIGSITHSQGWAAAVVARRSRFEGIGLDAERRLDAARAERLSPQILVPAERALMDTLPECQRGHFVTLVFSLKESLYKALYPLIRQRFYFPDASLAAWDSSAGKATLTLDRTLTDRWRASTRFEAQIVEIDDYLLTLIAIPRQS